MVEETSDSHSASAFSLLFLCFDFPSFCLFNFISAYILSQWPSVYLSVCFKLTVDLIGAPQRLVAIRIEQGDKLTQACFISACGSYYTL